MLAAWRTRKENKEKGFTLVELIIVMAILAVMAGIAVPRFGSTLDKSKKQAHNANVMMIEKAIELSALNGDTTVTTTPAAVTMADLVTDGYLKELPAVPIAITAANGGTASDTAAGGAYTATVQKIVPAGGATEQLVITVLPKKQTI